ncbi:MAG: hypothetical protein ABSE15_03080 [Candidatus Bathyarchaeia archaeon]|jgi:predicted nucleic acid-binding protein
MEFFGSSLVIDVLRKNKTARNLLESTAEKERVAITIISKYELLRGTGEKDLNLISGWLDQFIVYDFDDHAIAEVVKATRNWLIRGS